MKGPVASEIASRRSISRGLVFGLVISVLLWSVVLGIVRMVM